MISYRVQASPFATAGTFIVMADHSHPEAPMFDFGLSPEGQPDGRIIVCHSDDERALRDAIAREQETPKWWRDLQAFERAVGKALRP